MEAMSVGCALGGERRRRSRNLIEHEKNGLLVPGDPDALREASSG
jgi:hypothetical protein